MSASVLRITNEPSSDEEGSRAILTLIGVTKHFGPVAALTDVSLTIKRGEVHCLLGENGAGKSTLCNVIFGVHPGATHEIFLAACRSEFASVFACLG